MHVGKLRLRLRLPRLPDLTGYYCAKMLIGVSQLVFGSEFGSFYTSYFSHTIIRGIVASATALIIQIVNYKALFSIRLGHYLGMAVMVKGKFYITE